MCLGILGFQKKYDTNTLEETCRQALDYDRATYTFIKNVESLAKSSNVYDESVLSI